MMKTSTTPYPHPTRFGAFMDHAVYLVSILAPLASTSQVIKIWKEQTAAGVSLTMFAFNIFANIFLLIYGILHKSWPIIIMYIFWLIVNTSIVIGIVIYG